LNPDPSSLITGRGGEGEWIDGGDAGKSKDYEAGKTIIKV